ncbi:MAG: hypothetical protein LBS95_01570, partial [Mycoplasmataceae bacterium]|nr:hypothetical protein [Mycoplasmataceae bacterium]
MVKWNKIFVLSLFVPLTICLLPLTVIGCNKSTNKREWNGLQNPRIWWTQGVEFVHTSFVQCYENNFIDGTYDVSMGYNSNTLLKTWNGVSAVASFDNANGNWLNFSGTPTNACVSSIWISIDGVKSQVQ